MPGTDFSSDMKSPGGYGGSYSSGVGSNSYSDGGDSPHYTYGGGGITTGNTIYGNTAFGPSGGMATGYAMASGLPGVAYGPSTAQYSNFRNLDGTPMFGGMAGSRSFSAPNATQAYAQLQSYINSIMAARQARPQPAFGLLDAVRTAPLPGVPQPAPQFGPVAYDGYYFMRNPTQRPYNPATSPPPITINSPGDVRTVTQSPGLKDSLPAGVRY